MKVVCETCEAKYQIPDERVAGRRLKIRCRKCGGVMEARGDELAPHQAQAPSGAIEWFASVDGTPIGPLTTDEVVSRISTGVLDWDAHVWREGYAEWKTVDAADTIVRAVASSRSAIHEESRADSTERTSLPQGAQAESDDELEQDARTNMVDAPTIAALEDSPTRIAFDETPTRMYSGHSAPPGALQPVARSAFASRPPGSLPPIARPVLSESSPNWIASAPSVDVPRAQLTGGALPLPIGSSRAPASIPPVRAGYAGGEGSGLIDIRALASLAQTRMNAPQQPRSIAPPSNGNGYDHREPSSAALELESDPLASFGTGHGVAFAALDSLAPAANREKPKDKTIPAAILVGAAMIAAASFAALYITRAPVLAPPVVATAQPPAPVAAPEPTPLAAAEPVAPEAVEPAAEAAPASAVAEPVVEELVASTKAPTAGAPRGGRRPSAHKARDEAKAEGDPLESEPAQAKAQEKGPPPSVDDILLADNKPADKPAAEAKPAKPAPAGDRSIDDLLDTAVTKKTAAPPPAESAAAEAPSRADVLTAMRKVEPEVRACAVGEASPVTGTANVAITVAGSSGKVTSAEVTGLTGPVGSCIAKVARTATFAPFTRDKFSVTYPYRFQ